MPKKTKYIGLDIGGSKILLQVFDSQLTIMISKKIKTDVRHGKKGLLKQLYDLIDGFFDDSVKGIGVVTAGIVDQKKGVLVDSPHLPTGRNLEFSSLLKKRYKTRVYLDNDINGFLAEESQRAPLKNCKNVLAVMAGTGLGGAAIVDGKMMYGKDGFAGEFGHMIINQSDKKLKNFEQNISGYYLKKYPRLKKELVDNFGIGLANLNLIFNPEVIVLGGSVYHHHLASKKRRLRAIIRRYSLAKQAPKLLDAGRRTSVARGAVRLLLR